MKRRKNAINWEVVFNSNGKIKFPNCRPYSKRAIEALNKRSLSRGSTKKWSREDMARTFCGRLPDWVN